MANPPDDNQGFEPQEGAEDVSLDAGRPAVAAAPGKMMFIIGVAALFIFIVVKSLFFGEEKTPEPVRRTEKEPVAAALPSAPDISAPPSIPAPPIPTTTTTTTTSAVLPPPPPPIPEFPGATADPQAKAPTNEALNQRIKAPMIASGGQSLRPTATANKQQARAALASNDPNNAFSQNVLDSSAADKAEATRIGDLNSTIAQGKMIHAVMETAINSDLPGTIRAIVSHDIYAEAGREVLLPKGSRLIGVYNSGLKRGQVRVFVIWTRVIRPDGVDLEIGSPGVDALGRAGLAGEVDNKYFEAFSGALLTSAMDIGVAYGGESLLGKQTTTQSNSTAGNTTTTTGTAGAAAVTGAVATLGDVSKTIVGDLLDLRPTINIDQGTPVNVFVNRDLVFPSRLTRQSQFVE